MLTFARADGTTAFTAPSTDSTSMPVTVSAGPDQRRSPSPPVPMNGMPSSISASSRNSSSQNDAPVHSSRRSPSTTTSPRSSCIDASARSTARSASGAAPPNWPECFGPASVRTSIVTTPIPRRPIVSVGTPGRMLPMSPIDHRVRGEQLGPGRRERGERASRLLLALDDDLDPDRGLAIPRAQRADVHEDVRLRVGRAASVDRSVALGRLERRRLPLRLLADRHDVVVAVEEDGGRALAARVSRPG